ncbi:MAG: 3-phosphoshikimate 1-carboxyvinyltransferase [Rickettsiales bacterium]|nr:3-phosphoshikimate 1-carboxyvinyltransferase [Rickettsiales bacterium]
MTSHSSPSISAQSSRILDFSGKARVPGDKSISHRSLMLASQVLGTTDITGLLEGDDVLATASALRHLGVQVTRHGAGHWEVQGVGTGGLSEPAAVLDMGNAGTGARLMMGLLASHPFVSVFTGDESLSKRPMQRVIAPLEQIGAQFMSRSGNRLPLAMRGSDMPLPITYTLPVASAQVKSAILLASLNIAGTTTVIEKEATRDHTERMLQALGFTVDTHKEAQGHTVIQLQGQQELPFARRQLCVPADPSSAAFLVVAALITPNADLLLQEVCINPLRIGIYTTLKEMGAAITFENERMVSGEIVADIHVKHSALHGVEVPAERAPSMIDEYPILAVAAAFASGTTLMQGLSELRVKESDRLAAIAAGLAANHVTATIEGDSLLVTGGPVIGGGTVTTHFDHRIAMSFLVMGMASQKPVTVDDTRAIATSFPDFMALMNRLGAQMQLQTATSRGFSNTRVAMTRAVKSPRRTIAVDGPAASGKGTLARRLASHYGYAYLDTGSLYRAVGLRLIYGDHDPHHEASAVEAARSITESDLANPRLRQERIGQAASIVSAMPPVREALLEYQRRYAMRDEGAVLDGRDIGTVVCPDADVKIFITADMETRAKRRHRELSGEGIEVVYESVLKDLQERDERDSKRDAAPLKAAEGALMLDTTGMTAQEAFEFVLKCIER